jgi:AraC family transcriptional regulator
MKTGQRSLYAVRIERAISFIETAAEQGETPALGDVASAAAMSDYHFHRIFRLMTGETVADAIGRIRLGASLPELEKGIGEATGKSGYATSQAYARALKGKTGATPTLLKANEEARAMAGETLAKPAAASDGSAPPLRIEIASFEPLRVMAIRNVGDYRELNQGYGRLYGLLGERALAEAIVGIYGIPHDDPRHVPPEQCRFDCAFLLDQSVEPEGDLKGIELAGGDYARMDHLGDFDLIHDAIDAVYEWAITHDQMVDERPLFIHYLDDPDEVPPAEQRAQIWLPLAKGE